MGSALWLVGMQMFQIQCFTSQTQTCCSEMARKQPKGLLRRCANALRADLCDTPRCLCSTRNIRLWHHERCNHLFHRSGCVGFFTDLLFCDFRSVRVVPRRDSHGIAAVFIGETPALKILGVILSMIHIISCTV